MKKYIVAALLVLLSMASFASACDGTDCVEICPPCDSEVCPCQYYYGNTVTQSNSQYADAQAGGLIDEHAGSMAVVFGDGNTVSQSNSQAYAAVGGAADIDSMNYALIIGEFNTVTQMNQAGNDCNEPSITTNQLNSLIVAGTANYAEQNNWANAAAYGTDSTVTQTQTNFGLIFGDYNSLYEANVAYGISTGAGSVTQDEANTAYVFGINNRVTQTNAWETASSSCEADAIQAGKNLAFVISGCGQPTFYPQKVEGDLCVEGPQIPIPPAVPEYPGGEWPMDP